MKREQIKTIMQRYLLPMVYQLSKRKQINKNLVLLADAHHESLPYSMWEIKKALDESGRYEVRELCKDYQKGSHLAILKSMLQFMRAYANAGFVIICDNHLPVASCRKRPETKVIQLWHSGGALKRFGYDSPGNISADYHGGNVYANYDLITVSADYAVEPFTRAMKTDETKVQVTGISRTDWYFDEAKKQAVRECFYEEYPDARGRKIILWAPTFRGSAANPVLVGESEIARLKEALGREYFLIEKIHPHAQSKRKTQTSRLLAEQLLVVADVLISDYSSIIYDYAYFGRPLVLFTPDFRQYEKDCGFYEKYDTIPARVAHSYDKLYEAVIHAAADESADSRAAMQAFYQRTMTACDGHATQRILQWMENQ
ncbi:MAG: CDP-glycerol glycerophosphotransferase family protein [bacterium]|nr:CDP-glycerol glycerophosphotransferase family protein [bacterium]